MSQETFEKQAFFTTVRITIPSASGLGASIGTGFLYKAALNDEKNNFITLLISNKHVFGNPNGNIVFNFNKAKADGAPDFGNIQTFSYNNFSGAYYGHPNPDVDLACINASSVTHENVYYKNLHPDFLDAFNFYDVIPGMEVMFVGYPADRFDVHNNLPIMRKGFVASLPTVNFNNKEHIIIDAQVFQGSSGSPVFVIIDGHFKLLGVVSQTMVRNSQLQVIPTHLPAVGVQQILGLGIVIKQNLVNELIEYTVNEFKIRNNLS